MPPSNSSVVRQIVGEITQNKKLKGKAFSDAMAAALAPGKMASFVNPPKRKTPASK